MTDETQIATTPETGAVSVLGHSVPKIIAAEGPEASKRFVEFFTANIRNKNTRAAYAQAVGQFCRWCEDRRFALILIEPTTVAAYVEELSNTHSKPTVKQHLAATRKHQTKAVRSSSYQGSCGTDGDGADLRTDH